jgi:hypothetical protein
VATRSTGPVAAAPDQDGAEAGSFGSGAKELDRGTDTTTPNSRVSFTFSERLRSSSVTRSASEQWPALLLRKLEVARWTTTKGERRKAAGCSAIANGSRIDRVPVAKTLGVHRSTLHKALQGAVAKQTNGVERGFVRAE